MTDLVGATGTTGQTETWFHGSAGATGATGKFEFTETYRAAATLAHAQGMVAVIDRGPSAPKPAAGPARELTSAEAEAEKTRVILAKRERDEWHRKNPEPVIINMARIDADHSVSVDPDRYLIVPATLRAPVTVEERLARLELRLGPETDEEIKKRGERDAKFAADRDAKAKALADKEAAAAKAADKPTGPAPYRPPSVFGGATGPTGPTGNVG